MNGSSKIVQVWNICSMIGLILILCLAGAGIMGIARHYIKDFDGHNVECKK
jgi:hypothetical protein